MEIKELRSFVEIARTGSLTQAGKILHLSPAAIHRQLRAMEDELGVRLYEKRGNRLLLTQPGELILSATQDCLAQFAEITQLIGQWKGLCRGKVRIGTGPALSSYILPRFLRAFQQQHPDIDLMIQTGNMPSLLPRLAAGDLDVGLFIWGDYLDSQEVRVVTSWEMELIVVGARPDLPGRCSIQALGEQPFILYEHGNQLQTIVDTYLSNLGFQPKVIMRLDNPEAIKALVKAQLGLSLLAHWAVEEELRRGELQHIRLHEPPLHCKIALVTKRTNAIPAPVRTFLETAQQIRITHPRLVSRKHS